MRVIMSGKSLRKNLLATSVFLGASALGGAALAQETPTPAEVVDEETIVVTGSLIRNPNLERSAPVNVTNAAEIELLQINVAEDLIGDIPGVVPSVGPGVNNGNGGASFADLRGLGPLRNLVLMDGARVTPANFLGAIDLNNVPVALVERVDVLTGGATTTYGADAVTGVVNFVTRRNFEGFELQLGDTVTGENDGEHYRIDAAFGADLDNGRGNVVIGLGLQESTPVTQGDRAVSREALDSFTGGSGGSETAVPSLFSVVGQGNLQITPATGTLGPLFAPFNFAPYNLFQTPFERFNVFAAAHYEITDTIEAYARAIESTNTVRTEVAPSGSFGLTVSIPVSNPFLPVGARNTFCANNDFDPSTVGVQTLTPAQCAAAAAATNPSDPNYREFTTNLRRRSTEVGPRISNFATNFFDYQFGLRGDIAGGEVQWDVFASYGESENRQTLDNYVSSSRMRQALRATNASTCLDPSSGCVPVNVFGADGSISDAAGDFLRVKSYSLNFTSLTQARGTISGSTGVAMPWADEPVNFALGTEYREYTAVQTSDLLSQTPGELGGAGGAAAEVDGGYDVFELIGEMVLPIAQGQAWADDLTLELGFRTSDYNIHAPGATGFEAETYKIGLSWAPIEDLALRGNYSRAVRAPNIGEFFGPLNTGLTNLSLDPCQAVYPSGPNPNLANPNFTNICLAQGAPGFALGSIPKPTAGQANATFGGDPNLQPETADTYTIGLIFRPHFAPGLTATLDYYKIEVADAITSQLPGDAVAACFGTPNASGVYASVTAASAANPACTAIGRDPSTGELNSDPATTTGLSLPLSNAGLLNTDGVDLSVNWRTDLGFAELDIGFTGNYTLSSTFQASPTALNRECVGYYSVNCSFTGSLQPEYQWMQRTSLVFERFDVSLLWRHISAFQQEPEDILNGNGPGFQGNIPGFGTVDFQHIDAVDYFDLTGRWEVTDNLTLTGSVANLLNEDPPNVGSSMGSTTFNSGNTYPSTYDALGRRFSLQARLKF